MHTRFSSYAEIVWLAIIICSLAVLIRAIIYRQSGLVSYLAIQVGTSITMYVLARTTSSRTYYHAYCLDIVANWIAEAALVLSLYTAIRRTGIPGHRITVFRVAALTAAAVAIFTLRPSLIGPLRPEWKWIFAAEHSFAYWLCLMLVVAPFYARVVDAAHDTSQLLIYIGLTLHAVVNSGALDVAIATHLLRAADALHVTNLSYFASLALWLVACRPWPAVRTWNPADTPALKDALRELRIRRAHGFRRNGEL